MAPCAICNVVQEGPDSCLECSKCRNRFHPVCVGLLPEAIPRITEDLQRGMHWLCQTCMGKISLFSVYAHPDVNRMKLEIVAEVQSSVKQTIAAVQNKVDTTTEELKLLKQRHDVNLLELTRRIQALEISQASQLQETSFKFDDVHRQLRRDEVVIMRVPFKEQEDLRKHFHLDSAPTPRWTFLKRHATENFKADLSRTGPEDFHASNRSGI